MTHGELPLRMRSEEVSRIVPSRTTVSILLCLAASTAGRAMPRSATVVTPTDGFLPQSTPLELVLDEAPGRGERVVVELAGVDVSDLFRRRGKSLVYRPELLPLPAGENELVVSVESGDTGPFPER
jgi:hypothetical protein